jgi:hypothetical protein
MPTAEEMDTWIKDRAARCRQEWQRQTGIKHIAAHHVLCGWQEAFEDSVSQALYEAYNRGKLESAGNSN